MPTDVSVSREIGAPPELIWGMVSDLPRMGEWSNENVGGEWRGGATGPAAGARFRGANRNGPRRWNTTVVVTDATAPQRFAFRVTSLGIPVSEWCYEIEPTDRGCLVTESWRDARPGWFKPIARLATGVADRAEHTRVGMALTLDRLAATAETGPGEGSDRT